MEKIEQKKIKVYHVCNMKGYSSWIKNKIIVEKIEDANLVFFEGGEDVDPSLYGEKPHHSTYSNPYRDSIEINAYKKAKQLGLHCFGTCRGLQILTVLNNGKLVQDLHHNYWHDIEVLNFDGTTTTYFTNSLHHQLAYPFDLNKSDYKILGWADNISKYHMMNKNTNIKELPCEPEIIFYPKTNCLGIQGHPKFLGQ